MLVVHNIKHRGMFCCVTLRHRHFGAEGKIHRGRVDDDNQREFNKCAVIRVDR